MSECSVLEIQDLLPEYVAERLSRDAADQVTAHLASCVRCHRDVSLLRQIRSVSVSGSVAVVDVARISAAVVAQTLAPAPIDTTLERPALRMVDGAFSRSQSPPSVTARSARHRVRGWRMAAAMMLVVSGVLATNASRREGSASVAVQTQDSLASVMVATAGDGGASVSYGDLSDYSEGELEAMLATLEGWDGAARAEPAAFEPVVAPVGGNR